MEELIRSIGEGAQEGYSETVVAMLQARIGRFETGPRRVLRAASVFGLTFWLGGVAELLQTTADDNQVMRWLGRLVEAEVIEPHTESRLVGEREYKFRHALIREAAYTLLTENDLAVGHQAAARYLTRVGEREVLVLGDHYYRGGELERAIPLFVQATEDANRMSALPEARSHCSRARAIVEQVAETPAYRRLKIDLLLRQVQLGLVAETTEQNLDRLAVASALLAPLREEGPLRADDQRRSAWIDLLHGRISFYQDRPGEAIQYYRRALVVAEELDDEQLLALPSQFIGTALAGQGQFVKSRPLIARAVALQHLLDSDYDRLRAVSIYATTLVGAGSYREGMALHAQSIALATDRKQPSGIGIAHTIRACSHWQCGDFPAMLIDAELGVAQLVKSGDKLYAYVALNFVGLAYSFLGQPQKARAYRSEAQQLARQAGGRVLFSDWFDAGDAFIALSAGELELAQALAAQHAPRFRSEERFLSLGLIEKVWGLAIGRSNPQAAAESDAHLAAGLEIMEKAEQRMAAALLRLEWAQLCRQRSATGQAAALYRQAVQQLETAGCTHIIEVIERAARPGDPAA